MKDKLKESKDELRPEYDFDYSKAVRGKYHSCVLAEGVNVVPDAHRNHESKDVNHQDTKNTKEHQDKISFPW